MTGPHAGVIGMDYAAIIKRFLDAQPGRFEVAEGDLQMNCVLIETAEPIPAPSSSAGSRRAKSIERLRFRLD
jgi:calcineurin-like phosphoesterase